MIAVCTDLRGYKYPYKIYEARVPGRRPPSPAQQRMLDTMKPGVWHEVDFDAKPRREIVDSVRVLVGKGWLWMARIHVTKADGTDCKLPIEEILLRRCFLGEDELRQPFELFRLRAERGCNLLEHATRIN